MKTKLFRSLSFVFAFALCSSLLLSCGQSQGSAEENFQKGTEAYKNGQYKESVKWTQKAAEQGHEQAQYNLAIAYFNGEGVTKSEEKAVEWFRKAAEQGNGMAQFYLGLAYDKGDGVEENGEEAFKWYKKAAEQGIREGQCYLAICYFNGKGVAKNPAEGIKWVKKSAEQGYPMAKEILKQTNME